MLSVDYDEEKGGWQELKLFLMHRLKFLQQHKVYTMVSCIEGLKAYKHNGEGRIIPSVIKTSNVSMIH